jgi:hypothetical protein
MTEDGVRDDIAFIRRTIEDGRAYATTRSPDMMVWGVAVAIAYLGTYARARGWLDLPEGWIWAVCIGLPWAYSLQRIFRVAADRAPARPMTQALRMLWLGCGIFITTFALAAAWTGDNRQGWADIFSTAILGIGFFASASLCNLPWMRWVAGGWWLGFIATFALRHHLEVLPLSAALMLLLLALPGLVLLRSRPAANGR